MQRCIYIYASENINLAYPAGTIFPVSPRDRAVTRFDIFPLTVLNRNCPQVLFSQRWNKSVRMVRARISPE